jgi:hypothetical protein
MSARLGVYSLREAEECHPSADVGHCATLPVSVSTTVHAIILAFFTFCRSDSSVL